MKNILTYESFALNESDTLSLQRHNKRWSPENYSQRANNYRGVSADPGVLSKVGNFFQKMEDRLNAMASVGQDLARSRRSERPASKFNTGYEVLYGLPSVVPGVLKRVFGGTNYDYKNVFASEDNIDLDFMRHTNEEFVKNELPSIKSEDQLSRNIEQLYKKGNIKPGQSPVLDEIVRNRANIFYQYQQNPGSVTLGK
jgi:hypothetical protein